MTSYRVQERAGHRIDEIYTYTRDVWGETKARPYIRGLFDRFDAIAARRLPWRPIPAAFEVDVGIVTVLHRRMHQIERFHEDFWS